jgi:hypothetical protein
MPTSADASQPPHFASLFERGHLRCGEGHWRLPPLQGDDEEEEKQ